MRKTILLLVLVSAFIVSKNAIGQATDLIISEYIEGSSNNKALEVFNGTGATLDMTQYRFVRYNNGSTTSPGTFYFVGTLADGEVYVIANSSAGSEIAAVADTTSSITWYNGDDYLGLEKFVIDEWLVIDVIGVLGEDPGSCWPVADELCGTQEHTLVRKADICSPITNWSASAGTNATDSQWIVYNQNEFSYLGAHTSSCSGPTPLNANFTANDQTIYTGETVTFSDLTSGGEPPYSFEWDLDGDNIYETTGPDPQFTYNTAGKYTVRLRVTDNLSTIDIEEKLDYISVTEPNVTSIADLRAGDMGQVYTLTTEAILTYQQSYRNQKYIQDDFAAIMIDDDGGIITTLYNLGDGITGIQGTLAEYGNMMQFVPLADPGVATSTGNEIIPEEVTIDDLNGAFDDYEAELVKILGVTFDDAGMIFANGTVYAISDGVNALGNFRTTFYNVDYIGTAIPTTADIVVLPNARFDGNYVTSRSAADIVGNSNPATKLAIIDVNQGINPYANENFSVVVQAQDEFGAPGYVTGNVDFTFTTNGGDLGTVVFVGGTTTTGTITDGMNQVTVTGVQMAPEGTNVTITAVDVNPFGLTSGTSAFFDVVEFSLPDIIITEIMQNPADVPDDLGEWFEVFNNGNSDVDMMNWIIKDDGSNSHIITTSLIVPSKGFAVLGRNADQLTNGGYVCDYVYSGFTLGNSDDEVVLLLPDGVTEIDRVNYDGGPLWPDPIGQSMVYIGFPSEDNNIYENWSYAAFRELSYSGILLDKGSPGTNGYGQILTGGFKLTTKVFLEGPFNPLNDTMNNTLSVLGEIPYTQPYNPGLPYYGNSSPTWLYPGTEEISYVPYNAIDWVMVELRDASTAVNANSASMVKQFPAYLMNDGTVVGLNGLPIVVDYAFNNLMYIVIWHRNHLGILSSTGISPVDGTIESYNFTTGQGQVHGGDLGYKMLKTGIWGMMSGDSNGDQVIDTTDKTVAWDIEAGEAGYKGYDLNLDGEVNNLDKNDFWVPNNNKSSQVPN